MTHWKRPDARKIENWRKEIERGMALDSITDSVDMSFAETLENRVKDREAEADMLSSWGCKELDHS